MDGAEAVAGALKSAFDAIVEVTPSCRAVPVLRGALVALLAEDGLPHRAEPAAPPGAKSEIISDFPPNEFAPTCTVELSIRSSRIPGHCDFLLHLDQTLADLDDIADGALCSSFAITGLGKRQDQRIGMVRTEPQTILQLILRLEGSTSGR